MPFSVQYSRQIPFVSDGQQSPVHRDVSLPSLRGPDSMTVPEHLQQHSGWGGGKYMMCKAGSLEGPAVPPAISRPIAGQKIPDNVLHGCQERRIDAS